MANPKPISSQLVKHQGGPSEALPASLSHVHLLAISGSRLLRCLPGGWHAPRERNSLSNTL